LAVEFLSPAGVLVVWVDPQKASANETLRLSLEGRGFLVEEGTVHECGCAVLARRREMTPVRKAAYGLPVGERRIMETKPPIPRAILVGVQVAGVDDVTHAASIEELGLLVKTLGYEVVGTISQKRDEIDGSTVLGKGRLEELAAITGGDGGRRIDGDTTEIEGPRAFRGCRRQEADRQAS